MSVMGCLYDNGKMLTDNRKQRTENREQKIVERTENIIVKDFSPAFKLKTSKNNDKTKWQSSAS
jgi:hypothetical protein